MPVTIDAIRDAARQLEGRVVRTPSLPSPALSERCGAEIVLKLENLQVTGSFKSRGAYIKLAGLADEEKKAGVVAASAGNHAQGVAYHARNLGIPATIYMPEGTPFTKVGRTEALGAKVVLSGSGLAEARETAMQQCESEGQVFVHPYDDPEIIAGQGTVGLEFLIDVPDLEVLVVPIGGGGLLAGSAVAAKALNPDIEIIGVEAALFPSMSEALGKISGAPDQKAGTTGQTPGQTIAEGIAVKVPGKLTKPVIEDLVSDIVLADETSLELAVQTYLEDQRIVTEGAGAASLAAVLNQPERFSGRKTGLVVSGGNMDARLLSSILMRGLVREGRMVRLRIEITDTPGALSRVSGLIGKHGGNIIEIYHQRLFYDIPVKQTEVDVVLETVDANHVQEIMKALIEDGFPARLMGATSLES
ncbi:MAG: threonine ammonia-lyase [Rhodospirillales bacterium]|nr:threonine ammonia-lyase [Alphaproteobacteria bacterium]MBL6947757.1 threonine ammonia-lyase [Rhodospirillales bacterium]